MSNHSVTESNQNSEKGLTRSNTLSRQRCIRGGVPINEVWTVKDVASFLGIHELTAYRLARHGRIPYAKRVGGRWRFWGPGIVEEFKFKMGVF